MRSHIITEPLYPEVELHPWEQQLFESRPVRRLKQLAHFGAASLVSAVVHSRFEHTVGVWKLAAYFFPEDRLLRVAAILHDIGHLPFSHAVEKTLGFNHHSLTEQYIQEKEIAALLKEAGIQPQEVIAYLNSASPLTGVDDILGIDHLDSFLRDTYLAGSIDILPKQLLSKISCTNVGIEVLSEECGLYILKLIMRNHELFLSPNLLAVDRLLAEAIKHHWQECHHEGNDSFARLTDAEVLTMLLQSNSARAKQIVHTMLYEPSNIQFVEGGLGEGVLIQVRKIYGKTPLYQGRKLTESSLEAKKMMDDLLKLKGEYKVRI